MKTQKIILNKCYGGYSLSNKALLWLWEKGFRDNAHPIDEYYGNDSESKNIDLKQWQDYLKLGKKNRFSTVFSPDEKFVLGDRPEDRTNPLLVQCIQELGDEANGDFAELKIVEIPQDIQYIIEEYDGIEHIAEVHRTWG